MMAWKQTWLLLSSFLIATTAGQNKENETVIRIAGIYDSQHKLSDWYADVFNFTLFTYLPTKYPEIFSDVLVEGDIAQSDCTAAQATRAYGDLRERNPAIHGVIGCRCSDETIAVARVAELDNVPIVSSTSTSAKLSNKKEFPYVSRLVSPDNKNGLVGALTSLLDLFQWDRINIITSDTAYALDLSTELQNIWTGKVAYTGTISLISEENNQVDPNSVKAVLDAVPDDPIVKSRIFLLIAHDRHAYSILETAAKHEFQQDAIWIGPEAWVGLTPPATSWMPEFPGYLGVAPYRNKDKQYEEFLRLYQEYQKSLGIKPVWSELPEYYAVEYTVDAIVAMAMALSTTPDQQRQNASRVSTQLRALNFSGVSGPVSFTANGDRQNPQFTIYNLQKEDDGSYRWIDVGQTGITSKSASLHEGVSSICFAKVGCGLGEPPSDSYKVPISPITLAFSIVGPLIFALFLYALSKYIRTKKKKKKLKEDLANQANDVERLKENLINEAMNADEKIKKEKEARNSLILERGKMETPKTWSNSSDKTLVELAPKDEEYWAVASKFRETMPNAYISKLWRIQNIDLWSYYLFHKDRFARTVGDVTEREVWHGTSNIDPEMIYNDSQDGFMVQFARDGLYGRGNYFAAKSSYSHSYRYDATKSTDPLRPRGADGEFEMFYVRLLTGKEVEMGQNRTLACPPIDPSSGTKRLKFNTVKGNTGGSDVWIVYENGRAYPLYIIRYYVGSRDPSRTPFKSKEESMKCGKKASMKCSKENGEWFFEDNGWKPFRDDHQVLLKTAYESFKSSGVPQSIRIQTDTWNYEVDFASMVQKNIEHSGHKQRRVLFQEKESLDL